MASKIDRRKVPVASGTAATVVGLSTKGDYSTGDLVRAVGLRVDHVDRPLGLENQRLRLSWCLESTNRNVRQSAYRVLVASSSAQIVAGTGDLWDSGKVQSRKSFDVSYEGVPLQSRQRCWWCVRVWDENDRASDWSATGEWEMGLLQPREWTARWLAVEDAVAREDRRAGLRWIWGKASAGNSSRVFRGSFVLPSASSGGVLFAQGAQWTRIKSLWIDGLRIEPGIAPSFVGEWIVLKPLAAGRHSFAVEAETSTPPSSLPRPMHGMAFFARLTMHDGAMVRVGSSPDWKTTETPPSDWANRGLDDRAWGNAEVVSLDAQPWPPTSAMHLRCVFSTRAAVVSARLYATALGVYEARLNGRRIGDALLTPEPSLYTKRLFYRVYDVTELLRQGTNVLGITAGDGWYAGFEGRFAWGPPPRRVLAQLELTYADGSRQRVETGPGWRIAPSPILKSQIREGEVYDARLEQLGWDTPHFNDELWTAAELADIPACQLVAQVVPPIRNTQVLQPTVITQARPGVHVVDFGQCFAGWCRLSVCGERGTRIELRFADLIASSGEIDESSMGIDTGEPGRRLPKCDEFVLSGATAREVFEPKFTYRGFRYVQISGLSTGTQLLGIEGIVVHSDLQVTGSFHCDSHLLTQIWKNTLWTQRSNFIGVQTDNPHREQRAWLGDAGIFADTAAFNMDVSAFMSRQITNAVDGQYPSGAYPQIAPNPNPNQLFLDLAEMGSTPAWGDAPLILAWTAWRRYGDTQVIERNWDSMNRYVQFILTSNPDHVWRNQCGLEWGDHLAPGQRIAPFDPDASRDTSTELIGTAYWAHSAHILAQLAQAIGKVEDRDRLTLLVDRIRHAFNARFVNADGTVGTGSQTSQVLALRFGLLAPDVAERAAEKLAADVRMRGVALTTGILGTQFILDVLADWGYLDLAYGLMLRTDYPSWGYMIRNGATTIWENWKSTPAEGDSKNQPALGAIAGFLFRRVAGIDAAQPGFELVEIKPVLDPRVRSGGGHYDSIMGRISTAWSQSAAGFHLEVTIPANATACIHLPSTRKSRISESRREVTPIGNPRIVERLARTTVIAVGSGSYRFMAETMY